MREEVHFISIIAPGSLTRSLIGAQLKEEGFAVLGSATLEEAASQLSEVGSVPSLLVIESQGLEIDQRALDALGRICAEVPLLIIHGAWDKPSQLKWKAKVYELVRPMSIGEIVQEVKKILALDNK